MGIFVLPFIAGFFALFILIKAIGREYEDSAPWQIFVAIIVLTSMEFAANYVAAEFFSGFDTYLLMGIIFFCIGLVTALICKFAFWVPISKAILIAFLFVVVKIGLAFGYGFTNFGNTASELQVLSLWKPKIGVDGAAKIHKDPGWEYYDLNRISIRLPGPLPTDTEEGTSAPSERYQENFWALAKYPKMKLRYDYWRCQAPEKPDQHGHLSSALSRLVLLHRDAHVADRNEEFVMSDPTLNAIMMRVLLEDETIELEPASAYLLSVARGSEEWLFEIWGNDSEIEKFAQHSFPTIKTLSETSASIPHSGGDTDAPRGGYPVDRTLESGSNGKKIEATITGRTKTVVIFENKGTEFRYDISKLSIEDQAFINSLPLSE